MAERSFLNEDSTALLSSSLLAGGTITNFFSTLAAGRNASEAGRLNALIAERNAIAALQDAEAARVATFNAVRDVELVGRLRRGASVAASAARGVQADTGSPLEMLAADAYQTGREASRVSFEGAIAQQKLRVEADQHRFNARMLRKQAKHARRAAIFGAIGGLTSNLAMGLPMHLKAFDVAKSMLRSPSTDMIGGMSFLNSSGGIT